MAILVVGKSSLRCTILAPQSRDGDYTCETTRILKQMVTYQLACLAGIPVQVPTLLAVRKLGPEHEIDEEAKCLRHKLTPPQRDACPLKPG